MPFLSIKNIKKYIQTKNGGLKKMGLKEQIGPWSFIAGLILALVFAFVPPAGWVVIVLGILGLAVGLLNITDKEIQGFLLASVAFVVSSTSLVVIVNGLGLNQSASYVSQFLTNVATLMASAAAVVAIIALYKMAKD
jgi:hypothetical protein